MGTTERRKQVEYLHVTLRDGITQIFDTAYGVDAPAGSSPEWDALCAHYGVSPISDVDRQGVRDHQRPTRGATLIEFKEVVRSLCVWTRRETRRVDVDIIDDPADLRVLHERLLRLVDRVQGELDIAYRGAVLPARVGGMFGNVLKHHDENAPAKKWEKSSAVAFKCKNCGAPKLSKTDTECPFCGSAL